MICLVFIAYGAAIFLTRSSLWITLRIYAGWFTPPTIRINIDRPDSLGGSPFVLELTFHEAVDARGIAAAPERRVARSRL